MFKVNPNQLVLRNYLWMSEIPILDVLYNNKIAMRSLHN